MIRKSFLFLFSRTWNGLHFWCLIPGQKYVNNLQHSLSCSIRTHRERTSTFRSLILTKSFRCDEEIELFSHSPFSLSLSVTFSVTLSLFFPNTKNRVEWILLSLKPHLVFSFFLTIGLGFRGLCKCKKNEEREASIINQLAELLFCERESRQIESDGGRKSFRQVSSRTFKNWIFPKFFESGNGKFLHNKKSWIWIPIFVSIYVFIYA